MKLIKYISPSTVIFSTLFFFILLFSIFFIIRPFSNLEQVYFWWGIPLSVLLIFGLLLFDKAQYKKVSKEKIKLFQGTIHTVQDILQRSSSRMQNIILDMEEQKVSNSLQKEMHDCFNENVKSIQVLSSLNLEDLLKSSNKHLSSFLLKDKGK